MDAKAIQMFSENYFFILHYTGIYLQFLYSYKTLICWIISDTHVTTATYIPACSWSE